MAHQKKIVAENQIYWLQTMQNYQLYESGGYVITLHVPENTEREWVERFKRNIQLNPKFHLPNFAKDFDKSTF